jgi:hypothetical protein
VTERGALERAEMLIAELNEAFGKNTWARRNEARGPEMTAWRRAAFGEDLYYRLGAWLEEDETVTPAAAPADAPRTG